MAELMRLRIPMGWMISDNKFYDVDPIVDKDGFIENWHEGFMEDVLWIQEGKFIDGEHKAPQFDCFSIDISWLNKKYVMRLFFFGTDELFEIERLESKDRFEIRDKMELWLDYITENYMDYKESMKNRLISEKKISPFLNEKCGDISFADCRIENGIPSDQQWFYKFNFNATCFIYEFNGYKFLLYMKWETLLNKFCIELYESSITSGGFFFERHSETTDQLKRDFVDAISLVQSFKKLTKEEIISKVIV